MTINWNEIDLRLTEELKIQSNGTYRAKKALEMILGDELIKQTVEKAITIDDNSSELAMNCLSHISSLKAAEIAYGIYKNDEIKDRKIMSVWLIKQLAVKESYQWIEEFINDENVIGWGIGVLDQLLWCEVIDYDEERERIDFLLELTLSNSNNELKDNVDFIKNYLNERE
jgi:hypothetical protein